MLFPEKMCRVKIEIPEKYIDKEIENIGKAGVLHLDCKKESKKFFQLERKAENLLNISEKYLEILGIKKRKKFKGHIKNLDEEIQKIEKSLTEIGTKIEKVSNKLKDINRNLEIIKLSDEIKNSQKEFLDLEKLILELKFIKIKVGIIPAENLEIFKISIKEYKPFVVPTLLSEGSYAVSVFFLEDAEKHIKTAFEKFNIQEIENVYFLSKTKEKLEKEKKETIEEKEKLKERLGKKLIEINGKLKVIRNLLIGKIPLEKKDEHYVLCGWVPKKYLKKLIKSLKYSKIKYEEATDNAPVMLSTPKLLKPFERLIKEYSYPQYNEINPVVPFAVSFLLMFGIMFGDVGHGLTLSFLGYLVSKKYKKYKDYGNILVLSGFSSASFGFLYGCFFGFHGVFPHLLFNPNENIFGIFVLGIAVGIGIITLSFLINIITLYKRKNYLSLFFGEGGVLWLITYWFTIGIVSKYFVFNMEIKYDLIILSLLLVIQTTYIFYKKKEVAGSLLDTFREFLESITNTISFIRLGAFALAHGTLFLAVFTVAKLLQNTHGGDFFYWLVIILGNILIIALEGLIVTIQVLRLEYYEFFKRFYKGGGIPYKPYKLEG